MGGEGQGIPQGNPTPPEASNPYPHQLGLSAHTPVQMYTQFCWQLSLIAACIAGSLQHNCSTLSSRAVTWVTGITILNGLMMRLHFTNLTPLR